MLNYYRSDRLDKPSNVSREEWDEELLFYNITPPEEVPMTEAQIERQKILAVRLRKRPVLAWLLALVARPYWSFPSCRSRNLAGCEVTPWWIAPLFLALVRPPAGWSYGARVRGGASRLCVLSPGFGA